jgi:hypothetical protein
VGKGRLEGIETTLIITRICLPFIPPPVTKFIRIGIADKNDNPPYFDKALYEAEVDENEDIQHTVLTVTAKDHDECEYKNFLIVQRLEVSNVL